MNKMKNTIMLIVLLLISVQVNAEEMSSSISTTSEKSTVDEYKKYLNIFREEFKSELLKWEFKRIDEKIKGYTWDVEYISSEKGSQYAGNLDIYKTKLKALKQIREEYISNLKENVTSITKESSIKKDEVVKAIEEKKQKLAEEAKKMKEEKLTTMDNLKQKKLDLVKKYKENYSKKLWEKLGKLSEEQLQKALERTNKLIEKYATKESALVQLTALKELIQEKLEASSEINIDEIFEDL